MNYTARLTRLKNALQSLSCEALLIENPIDLFYLTGLELSAGKLIITLQETCLIVDGRYDEQSRLQTLYPVQLLKENILQDWLENHSIKSLGFDQHHTTYHAYIALSQMAAKIKKNDHALELLGVEQPIQLLRMIKDEEEIECLRKAAQLGCDGYAYIAGLLTEGISEMELALELEFFWKKRGASGLAFDPIIAFGPASSMPHYRAGRAKLTLDSPVLIDIGVVLDHYHSDMTRTHFFGSPSPIMETIYTIVEEAKERALKLCKPGALIGDIDRCAREWIASHGHGEHFTHSLGHGIGLEIHEPPILRQSGPWRDTPLQAGMVITIEPGIYLPGLGGVRLEDTILITPAGYECLTC